MPGTYSQLLYHLVFSTKHRTPWISPDIAARLYPYLGGILRAQSGTLYSIGGMPDHLHLYIQYRTDDSLSNLLRTLKARSSLWLHETFPTLAPITKYPLNLVTVKLAYGPSY
jgi:putative transposase